MRHSAIRLAFIALTTTVLLGCSRTAKPVVPVEGKITFEDGSSLPEGTRVVFNPSEGKVGTSSGTTDATGTFKLVHVSGTAGAEVGKYHVQLLAPEGGNAAAFYKQIPRDYYEGGMLTADVQSEVAPIALKVPKLKK